MEAAIVDPIGLGGIESTKWSGKVFFLNSGSAAIAKGDLCTLVYDTSAKTLKVRPATTALTLGMSFIVATEIIAIGDGGLCVVEGYAEVNVGANTVAAGDKMVPSAVAGVATGATVGAASGVYLGVKDSNNRAAVWVNGGGVEDSAGVNAGYFSSIQLGGAALTATAGLNMKVGTTAANGIAFDTANANLYRSAASVLKTDGAFTSGNKISSIPSGLNVESFNADSTSGRGGYVAFRDSGTFKGLVGSAAAYVGSGPLDMALAADSGLAIKLFTNGSGTPAVTVSTGSGVGIGTTVMTATTGLNLVGGTTSTAGIAFGTDTLLYRAAAGALRTSGAFRSDGDVVADYGAVTTVAIGSTLGKAGLAFSNNSDASLSYVSTGRLHFSALNANGFDFAVGSYAGGSDVGGVLSFGTGAPNNTNGANGDIYLRVDGGALTTVYQRRAGAWVGIV